MDSIRVKGIDVIIQIVFRVEHIPLIIPHFKQCGLSDNILNEIIDAHIRSGEVVTFERFFLEYGQLILNPTINRFLKRPDEHPTFNNLLKYALSEVIDKNEVIKSLKKPSF